jgi:GntR family transcriptional repressor for pyruvate dehydrogenase complex
MMSISAKETFMFEPVSKKSLSDVVFDQLSSRIVNHELKAGDELPSERILCELLQVNRGAVREAIKRLEQAGLIQVRHGGGTKVLDYSEEAGPELLTSLLIGADGQIHVNVARSIVRMRQVLSPEIAADAALNSNEEMAELLDAIVEKMEHSQQAIECQLLAFEFWGKLVQASGNIAYQLAFNSLRKAYQPILELLTQVMQGGFTDLASFRRLAKLVRDGDREPAFSCAKEYIDRSSSDIYTFLDAYERLAQPASQQ